MKNLLLFLFGFCLIMVSCEVDQTEEGEMPEVDVNVETEEGNLPEYDVDWADVNVGTRTKTVKVPKVVVHMEEEEVEVPYINVDMPEEYMDDEIEKEERSLMVEAEISDEMKEVEINEVYADGKRLYVVAELKSTGKALQDETVRISDQLVLNAPEDLDVKYLIIGERPEGNFNTQYTYVSTRNELNRKIGDSKKIY